MIKIAFPKNKYYQKLFARSEDFSNANNIRLFKLSESECDDFILRNLVDCAFLSPLGYGKGVKIADFRIVPGPLLFAYGYTGLASIFFRQGLDKIGSVVSNSTEDFIVVIGKLILKEKFGIDVNLRNIQGEKEDLLLQADSVILWGSSRSNESAIDVTEEWFDLIGEPLPLGFWVVRAETYPPDIQKIVENFAIANLPAEEEIVEEIVQPDSLFPRKGQLILQWRADLEDSIATTLLFLYLHQILQEIPAVKILGRD